MVLTGGSHRRDTELAGDPAEVLDSKYTSETGTAVKAGYSWGAFLNMRRDRVLRRATAAARRGGTANLFVPAMGDTCDLRFSESKMERARKR